MKRWIMVMVLLALTGAVWAQGTTGTTTMSTDIRGLTPYSEQTRYMSLEGYVRWVTFQNSGRWITWTQAAALVQQQTTAVAAAPAT